MATETTMRQLAASPANGRRVERLPATISADPRVHVTAGRCAQLRVSVRRRPGGHVRHATVRMRFSGQARCIGVRAHRFESGSQGNGGAAGYGRCSNAAGCELRVKRAGGRGHGPTRARRAWAAASITAATFVLQYAAPHRVLVLSPRSGGLSNYLPTWLAPAGQKSNYLPT